jgi:hypothetical protein
MARCWICAPGFPARDRRFAHAQQVRELHLRQPQFLAALANLLRRQESGRAAESGADLLIGLVVDAERLAVAAPRDRQDGTSTDKSGHRARRLSYTTPWPGACVYDLPQRFG